VELTEHQAKTILRKAGICTPAGAIASTAEEAHSVAKTLGASSFVVKAQIRAGGRAKGYFQSDAQSRGGIRFARTADDVRLISSQMLDRNLITEQTGPRGELVKQVYVEAQCKLQSEKYLALTIDRSTGSLAFLASAKGGSNIESAVAKDASVVHRYLVDIQNPVAPSEVVELFGYNEKQGAQLHRFMDIMIDVMTSKDATLIEINPLGLDDAGELIALDAAIIWDQNALFRQGHEEQMAAYEDLPEIEFQAMCKGLNYIKFKGKIGTVSSGAGLAMATIDALHDRGGTPGNFLDIPPSSTVTFIKDAITLVLSDPELDAVIINVFGGGIMRCDAVADALLVIGQEETLPVPIVVRLAGTNAQLAQQRIKASLPQVLVTADLSTAISNVVKLAQSTTPSAAPKPWWRWSAKTREEELG
jgi:succinyl-CoA synthetase beta subunit